MHSRTFLSTLLACTSVATVLAAPGPNLIDYFRPMPITSPLTAGAWGLPGVLPRDVNNGLEDKANKSWSYWDGKILHAPRKRVLRPRVDAFIDNRLRKGPTDDVPVAEAFVLEGDQEVSIFDEKAVEPVRKNGMVFHVLGVFDLISDTPAVWLEKAKS